MSKVLNFDLFMAEHNRETIEVTVFGDVYKVPCEVPAIVPIMMARAEESKVGNDSTKMIMKAADAMFGAKNLDKMCAKGLTAVQLANLIERLFKTINGTDEEEEQELDDESGKKQVDSKKRSKK